MLASFFLTTDVNIYILECAADGQFGPNVGQAIFSLWMALGSVLGYSSGANAKWPEYVVEIHTPIGFFFISIIIFFLGFCRGRSLMCCCSIS
jgi:hypothetical protein